MSEPPVTPKQFEAARQRLTKRFGVAAGKSLLAHAHLLAVTADCGVELARLKAQMVADEHAEGEERHGPVPQLVR